MKSDMELLLEASLEFVRMRKALEEVTAALAATIHENDLLREQLKLAELKLQRIARPRIVA